MDAQHFGRYHDTQYDVRYRFMNGECHLLALELHERTGWPLLAVKTGEVVLHVAVHPPGHPNLMLDIKGLRPVKSFAQDYDCHIKYITTNTVQSYINRGQLYAPTSAASEVARLTSELVLAKLNTGE